jgi:long-subunit acyl-CoA synthetase (AMP-forming)
MRTPLTIDTQFWEQPGPITPLHAFYYWEKYKPQAVFLRQPYGKRWHTVTWQAAGDQARRIASALKALGVQKGTLVGLLSRNCYHWILADLAIAMTGAVSVPFYANLAPDDLRSVLEKSEVTHLFVGKLEAGYWEKVRPSIPDSIRLIHFPPYLGCSQVHDGESWEHLLRRYPPLQDPYYPTLEDLWTILYTSGTTGTPKGVMLPYRCPVRFMEHEHRHGDFGIFDMPTYRVFSYLPLNHIAERIGIEVAALYRGGEISFAESVETFPQNLRETQPTFFVGVPRIWQRFQQGILARFGGPDGYRRWTQLPLVGPLLKAYIRRKLGLGRVQVTLTGAAITPDPLKVWFHDLGMPLREVYAMTENCAGCTVMPRGMNKLGTVGKPLHEVRLRIDPETHEILMQAAWVMDGYYKDPEKTAEVLREGWLHTGDTGELDEEGFLRITGRLKDTFKTAKGLFVAPEPLETPFAQLPYIEQVCVVGLGLRQPLLLATISELGLKAPRPEVEAAFLNILERVNEPLPTYQRLARIVLLSDTWSTENTLLTPTLKVRRAQVHQHYSPFYEAWLEDPNTIIWYANKQKPIIV